MKKPAQLETANPELEQAGEQRRRFMEKFGKLAGITPIALTLMMSPATSAPPRSGCNKNSKGCK